MSAEKKANRLIHETSPYLLQHAHNPVDWYPWAPEAFQKAQQENKPILLSIGYAACHWCHVMAHESFADDETAQLMNRLFINIKVDREERPDLDKVYQTAHYLLTQRQGGWPLTVFLTPDDSTPYFSGTYFPKQAQHGLPAFKELLRTVAGIYQNHAAEIKQQNQELRHALSYENPTSAIEKLNRKPLEMINDVLQHRYDKMHGGFTQAPKFAHPTILEFLLQTNPHMAIDTLCFMANGGIYDQLDGGFFRYSVDEQWLIPHFEKMLYDNAQLLFLYTLASKQRNKEPIFAETARKTANWILHTMQSPEGGYYSSLDADTEGHEGKFYVWDKVDIQALLSTEEYQLAETYFGLDKPASFEKHWHLYVAQPSLTDEQNTLLTTIKQKLLSARNQRITPACDNKILTAWNALAIKAMAIAGDILKEPPFIESAQRALTFIHEKMWLDKKLFANYNNGKAHLNAYLDDYAFLLDAVIMMQQVAPNEKQAVFARELADALIDRFNDTQHGGFYFTANDHEKLLYRPKTFIDESLPSGNGVAARALLKLGHVVEELHYLEAAEKTLLAAWPLLSQFPAEHCSLLLALKDILPAVAITSMFKPR